MTVLSPPGRGHFKRHKRHKRHNPHEHWPFLRAEASHRSVTSVTSVTFLGEADGSRAGMEVEWDWGARSIAAHVSPIPSIHSVRWVFPSTVGRRLSQMSSLPLTGLLGLVPLSPGLTLSRGLVALAGKPLTVSLVRLCLPSHRPLAQRGLSYPHLQTLLRPDAPV